MLTDGDRLWTLLRALDDPAHLEHPADFRQRRERMRFDGLARRLREHFGDRVLADRAVEDASFLGRIEISAEAATTGAQLVLTISNFGGLAVLSVENPGVWSDAEAAELLAAEDERRIDSALAEFDYLRIPEEPLWEPYDRDIRGIDTWWVRFFSHL
ncbi:MAG: hypothetical protein HOV79_08445 [Hamadaea sp.]|nr:hypothetical protein [Hamadaea sp.]